jgi:hypothetical protein
MMSISTNSTIQNVIQDIENKVNNDQLHFQRLKKDFGGD